ncbi:sialic acid-binding Ig-like lectin 5 isoform X2 [Meriones unguiculatus]|uniref:sialic acid-binding Ig-like lectin 5 isoform X2 n=1 Tax=Meriones unguiculatus TaxID=10047 RepID=UPI00293F46B3|nr:sialic acid-binding Ig-like lectin 5 isoform X2 [Meriones unguiculatus]
MLWPLLLPLLWAGSLAQQEYELSVTTSVTVQEGLCIFVSCQAQYPSSGSVFGYWFQNGANANKDSPVATNNPARSVLKKVQGRFHLVGGQDTRNCSLDIRDAQKGDTGVYFFRVEGSGSMKYSFLQKTLSVNVIALTKIPKFQVTTSLVSGKSTQLICSLPWACERGTPPIFSWMSSAITSLGHRTTLSSELNLTPRPQDHGANLTCQVTFPGAGLTVEKTEQLSVAYAPQKLTIRVSRGDDSEPKVLHSDSTLQIQESESLRLVCVSDSNPPATLSWKHLPQKYLPLSTPEELHLPRVELEDGGKYVCQAQNLLGTQVASVSLSVRSLLQLLGPSCFWEAEGLHCSCSSRAWPPPSLRWRLGEGLLEGNSSNASFKVTSSSTGPWANSSLSLSMEFRADRRLSCEAWNDNGVQGATILLLPSKEVTKDKPETSSGGLVQGALWGAGLMVLLAVCLCLIFFIVKVLRKKSALKVAGIENNPPAVNGGSVILPSVSVSSPTQVLGLSDLGHLFPQRIIPDAPSQYLCRVFNIKTYRMTFKLPGFPDLSLSGALTIVHASGHLNASGSQNQKEQPRLDTAPLTLKDELELYYASLSFQSLRPRQPQNEQSIKSDYAEIKIHKC